MTEHPPQAPHPLPCEVCEESPATTIVRRRFLERLSIFLSSLIGAMISIPAVGFVLAPIIRRAPSSWRDVGAADSFPAGSTVKVEFEDPSPLPWAGVTARTGAWLRRQPDDTFIAYSINCRHLGCPVRWLADAKLFMCPCHGGVYYQDGTVAAGPPPAPLMTYPVRVVDGRVQIETSPIPLPGDDAPPVGRSNA